MNRNLNRLALFSLCLTPFLLSTCGPSGEPASSDTGEAEASKKVSFATEIKPLLESRCLVCHNTGTLLGHLNLENKKLAFEPGPNGPFIVPGKPQASKLYTFTLISPDKLEAMPPTKHRLSDAEKNLLRDWIAQGAEWPEGPEGTLETIPEPTS